MIIQTASVVLGRTTLNRGGFFYTKISHQFHGLTQIGIKEFVEIREIRVQKESLRNSL